MNINRNWIDCDMTFEQMQMLGINKVGLLFQVAGGSHYLIGDINELGGGCDCCSIVGLNEKVTRYCVVWVS